MYTPKCPEGNRKHLRMEPIQYNPGPGGLPEKKCGLGEVFAPCGMGFGEERYVRPRKEEKANTP
jgi:hypothetical protein